MTQRFDPFSRLLQAALPRLKQRTIRDLRVGLAYVAAQLDDGSVGVASTIAEWPAQSCQASAMAGEFPAAADELATLMNSSHLIDSAVGLSVVNAVLNRDIEGVSGDLLGHLEIRPDDHVGMVGFFAPFMARLQERCRRLTVFERKPVDHPLVVPDWKAEDLLPEADVVILSATTLLNRTLPRLLELCQGARTVALTGPTTPLFPEAFSGSGVHLLAGMEFLNGDKVVEIVGQAGGTRRFSPYARKVLLRVP